MPKTVRRLPRTDGHKTCWECRLLKREAMFSRSARNTDGVADRCKDCARHALTVWRAKNPDKQRAIGRRQSQKRRLDPVLAERSRRYQWTRREAAKIRVIDKYGGSCACCHESNIGFLTIDHINGGGMAHRKTLKRVMWHWLDGQPIDSSRFRLLCFNCNCGRHWNGGACPHVSPHPYSAQ